MISKPAVQFIERFPVLLKLAKAVNFPIKCLRKITYKTIDRQVDAATKCINIGGLNYVKRHWYNLDFITSKYNTPSLFIDYNHNLASHTPFPLADESVSFFYSSHTFEHIPGAFAAHNFSEIYRCLKKGGVFRITLPDFDKAYAAYQDGNMAFFKTVGISEKTLEAALIRFFATDFVPEGNLVELVKRQITTLPKPEFADYFIRQIDLKRQAQTQNHICWWNPDKITQFATQAGFSTVYSSEPQKSDYPQLRGKGLDQRSAVFSLFMEMVK